MIKVLIVEDDPMVAQINKRYVESIDGFEVREIAVNGEEALQIMKRIKIDLVIVDIYMPKLNGIDMLKAMRKSGIMADVIMVTAARETQQVDEALTLGAVDYLIKPFEYERLKNALESYQGRFRLLKKQQVAAQADIDKITMGKNYNRESMTQKGLHSNTLNRIRKFMENHHDCFLTSEEVAEKLGITKVTVRRYLEYLESIGEVKLEVEYGSIGRPSHRYKYIK
ncbi:MAG: response regulator [Bacillota bacterium]